MVARATADGQSTQSVRAFLYHMIKMITIPATSPLILVSYKDRVAKYFYHGRYVLCYGHTGLPISIKETILVSIPDDVEDNSIFFQVGSDGWVPHLIWGVYTQG